MFLGTTEGSTSPQHKWLWNSITSFFTSVRTAITLLFLLAFASIVGTVIPQDLSLDQLQQSAGSFYFRLAVILDLHRVYRSWWFMLLLSLLSLNLLGCLMRRLRRIPDEWRGISGQNSFSLSVSDVRPPDEVRKAIFKIMEYVMGTRPQASKDNGTVHSTWTKHRIYLLGFPLIHAAIIVILLGSVVGLVSGYKGTIQIKEGAVGNRFTLIPSGRLQTLPFEIAVDAFSLTRYSSGEPKEFRSDIRITKNGSEVAKGSIRVNHPFTYDYISLYQSDYRVTGVREVNMSVGDLRGTSDSFTLRPNDSAAIPGTEYTAKLLSLDPGATKRGAGVEISAAKADEPGKTLKLYRNDADPLKLGDVQLRFLDYKPLYATGLQVVHDPGSPLVWIGCILLIVGFILSLFTNLRRMTVDITRDDHVTIMKVSGRSRKMRREFRETVEGKIREAFKVL